MTTLADCYSVNTHLSYARLSKTEVKEAGGYRIITCPFPYKHPLPNS